MATGSMEKVTNNSGSGYCKMPDGTLICYGSATVAANGYTGSVAYPVPFMDTDYSIVIAPYNSTNVLSFYAPQDMTKNGCEITRQPITNTNAFRYIAIGHWK